MKFAAIFSVVLLCAVYDQSHGARLLSPRFWRYVHSLVGRQLVHARDEARSTAHQAVRRYFIRSRGLPVHMRYPAVWRRVSKLVDGEILRCRSRFHLLIHRIENTVNQMNASLGTRDLRSFTTSVYSSLDINQADNAVVSRDFVDNILGALGEYFKVARDIKDQPLTSENATTIPIPMTSAAENLRQTVLREVRQYPTIRSLRMSPLLYRIGHGDWERMFLHMMPHDVFRVIRAYTDIIQMYVMELADVMNTAAGASDWLMKHHPEWPEAVKRLAVSTVFDAVFDSRERVLSGMVRSLQA